MFGRYEATLIALGVDPEDARRSTSRLSPNSGIERILPDVWQWALDRMESLSRLADNPRDKITVAHLESLDEYGITVFTVTDSAVNDLNGLIEPANRKFLSISDLVHPIYGKRCISFVGAYSLSKAVKSLSCLGSALNEAVRKVSTEGVPFESAITVVDQPLLEIAERIDQKGGWRWFVSSVLEPLRKKVAKYYPNQR